MKRIAVILCGSGFKDGSEIRESVGVLWALSEEKADASCFALNEAQFDVVDCLSGKSCPGENRNQLVESARIARGAVRPLSDLDVSAFDALVIPGGFGAAKNLCSFAREGSGGKVHALVQEKILAFYKAGKPIGAVCIAPAILALALRGKGIELTVGAAGETAIEIEKLGQKHIAKLANEWHTDQKHKIVSTPAYMFDGAPLREIFTGIRGLVGELIRLA